MVFFSILIIYLLYPIICTCGANFIIDVSYGIAQEVPLRRARSTSPLRIIFFITLKYIGNFGKFRATRMLSVSQQVPLRPAKCINRSRINSDVIKILGENQYIEFKSY